MDGFTAVESLAQSQLIKNSMRNISSVFLEQSNFGRMTPWRCNQLVWLLAVGLRRSKDSMHAVNLMSYVQPSPVFDERN